MSDEYGSLAEFVEANPEKRRKVTRVAAMMDEVKGNAGHPNRLITFDTETRPLSCVGYEGDPYKCPSCIRSRNLVVEREEDTVQSLIMACATFSDFKRRQFEREFFTDESEFWDWVESKAVVKMVTWVVNHNINFDLMVLAFNRNLVERGWTTRTLVLPDPSGPTMMEWTKEGKTLKMVNLANWWGMRSLKSIGEVLGEYKGDIDPTDPKYRHARPDSAEYQEMVDYCHQDAYVVVKAVREWAEFCRVQDLGTFSMTQAGQSLTSFRHRFMKHEIYLHNSEEVTWLERQSYKGARTECFRVGSFTSPPGERFYYVDINSLYPSVMYGGIYPSKLQGHLRYTDTVQGLSDLRELIADESICVIARVQCEVSPDSSTNMVIPHRGKNGRLLYPSGRFTETLTTRELRIALERGVITGVLDIVTYEGAPLFAEYVDYFYRLRQRFKRDGNLVFTEIVKVFLNSLYGKFGQKVREWSDEDVEGLNEGVTTILVDGVFETFRNLGDRTEKRDREYSESRYAFPAIAAHITADARCVITVARECAGSRDVYYCDTDSLFVTETGYKRLADAGWLSDTELGKLKLETTAETITVNTLKDYVFGEYSKRKGMRKDAITEGNGTFRQVQFRGLSGAMRDQDVNRALVGVSRKRFTGEYNKGSVRRDGWVTPIHLDETLDIPEHVSMKSVLL